MGYQCSPQGTGSVCTLAPVNPNPAGQNSGPNEIDQIRRLEKIHFKSLSPLLL